MTAHVKCTHTKGQRIQECLLVLVDDRLACIPIAPSENALAKIAGGIAMTALGVFTFRLGERTLDLSELATVEELDAVVAASGGFHLGADWLYRTNIPMIGTMLTHGNENITTRAQVPGAMLALLTPNRAAPSSKVVVVFCAIGGAILAAATISYLATGSLELLFGIGFWGLLIIGAAVFAWLRLRRI